MSGAHLESGIWPYLSDHARKGLVKVSQSYQTTIAVGPRAAAGRPSLS